MVSFFGDEQPAAGGQAYEHAPNEPCPECGGWLILFTGYEMYDDNPIAKNYHCEECDTHFSEEYGDGPFE